MKKFTAICLAVIICVSTMFCMTGCEAKQKLYLYNWGDYMDQSVITAFEKKYNVTVVQEYFDRNEDMYIKVKNGTSDYDVLVPSEYMIERLIKDDLLYKLDFDNIPNYSNISPMILEMSNGVDLEYMVPFMWGTLGILYNPEVVSAEEAKSWDVLWNEKYSGKIVMIDSVRDSFAAALIKLGYSINTTNEEEIEKAAQLLRDQMPLVVSYETDTIKGMLADGSADLALTYSGEAVAAKALAAENGKTLDFVIPDEGGNVWYDGLVIPKTSKNKELAETFINFLCEAENAKLISEYIGYATANEAAYEILDEELKGDEDFWATEDIFKKCTVFKYLGSDLEKYQSRWSTIRKN